MQRTPTSRKSGSNAPHRPFNLTVCIPDPEATETQCSAKGEQLLDRIDKNPNDREAWDELARESPTRSCRRRRPQKQKAPVSRGGA
jgi:hypothetical protein